MASGTQGYQKTTTDKSLADTLISEYKKLRKRAKSGGSENPIDPANLKFVQDSVQAVDDFIVSGINGITSMFSTSVSPLDPVNLDDGTAIDVENLNENKKQSAILEAQNGLLVKFIDLKRDQLDDAKRLRQEKRLEDEEFLSGTQGWPKKKKKESKKEKCECNDGLLGAIRRVHEVLVPVGVTALALKSLPMTLKASMSRFANIFRGMKMGQGIKDNWARIKNLFNRGNKNVDAKNAIIDQKGNILNNKNTNNLTNVTEEIVETGTKNKSWLNRFFNRGKKTQLQLPESQSQRVDLSGKVDEFVPEEVFVDSAGRKIASEGGETLAKNATIEIGSEAVESGSRSLGQEIVETSGDLVKANGGKLVKNQGRGWLRSLGRGIRNPKNWRNPAVALTIGIAQDAVRHEMDRRKANKDLEGFDEKSEELQEKDIQAIVIQIKKLESLTGPQKALEFSRKMGNIIENVVTLGFTNRGVTSREAELIHLYAMLKELEKRGYGQMIKEQQLKIDESGSSDTKSFWEQQLKEHNNKNNQSSAFSTENILGNQGVEVASTDLTGVLGDTNNISKVNGQNFFQTSSKTTNGELKGLTEEDYDYLAYAISGEAAQGTDDIYGVAASILNRKARGDGTVKEIISAPGQYKAFEDGTMKHSPDIKALLQSKEGQAKIMEALRVLEGRTDFKGQSQLGNRVASEDPMFDEKGNFYHHSWQTSGDSVKPEGWEPANWQQFMPTELEGAKGLSNKLSTSVASLSNETSNAPNIIVMPTTTNTASTSGSNDGGTQMSMIQLQTENKNLSAYAQNSLQSLNA